MGVYGFHFQWLFAMEFDLWGEVDFDRFLSHGC